MAIDVFNLAAQSFVGGAARVGVNAVNNLTSSAIGAVTGKLTGGYNVGGLIGGTGSIPDLGCGFPSSHFHDGFGLGFGGIGDPCGRYNGSITNAIEGIGLNAAAGAIGALGQLALGGNRTGFGNAINGIATGALNRTVSAGVSLGVGLMTNVGSAAASSLISTVGKSSLSDAGSFLKSASNSVSNWI